MDLSKSKSFFVQAVPHILLVTTSGVLLSAYAAGFYLLGFVALVPWLIALELINQRSNGRIAVLNGVLMSMVYALAVFAWFGAAIADYVGISNVAGVILICLLAPVWQPQFWIYALVRSATGARVRWLSIALAIATWVISEWLVPKVLGDTLGHGLAPSLWLRQAADLAGAAGLTTALLITNAAFAVLWIHLRKTTGSDQPVRSWLRPLMIALLVPALLASYGALRLRALQPSFTASAPGMRVGIVQSSIVDYEQRRHTQGSYAVVRQVLDAHFALSRAAVEHHGADALVWSETVYPTPYGYPRSKEGAAFDFELKKFIEALNVPLLFGSYDVDSRGEYNAAVLLDPKRAQTARYRKTRLFPFTEQVPRWLDSAWLRRLLPWTGSWLAGDGARVFPLTANDGRELQVVPLICLDDVDPMLAIEGARLGAQAIVGLSNDSWFSRYPSGVRLHLAVASFRSIETRMPQLRVTTNGYSAFIDPSGEILARTGIGDQSVLAGEVPIRMPPATLVTRWGQWLAPAALTAVVLLSLLALAERLTRRATAKRANGLDSPTPTTAVVSLLTTPAYLTTTALQLSAAIGLGYLAFTILGREAWQIHSVQQLQLHVGTVMIPLLLVGLIFYWHRVHVEILDDRLRITRGKRVQDIELTAVKSIRRGWFASLQQGVYIDCTAPHSMLRMAVHSADAAQWMKSLWLASADSIRKLSTSESIRSPDWLEPLVARHQARWRWLDHSVSKFLLFPLIMALPAFRLHQVISFGGSLGEYYSFGPLAYLQGLMIWWASWSLGLMLWAALLRVIAEAALFLCVALGKPSLQVTWRSRTEMLLRVMFYLAVPIWFALRVFWN
jgi:apolipoprotein N-acyltransferase